MRTRVHDDLTVIAEQAFTAGENVLDQLRSGQVLEDAGCLDLLGNGKYC
jgi:hypothetical protein